MRAQQGYGGSFPRWRLALRLRVFWGEAVAEGGAGSSEGSMRLLAGFELGDGVVGEPAAPDGEAAHLVERD